LNINCGRKKCQLYSILCKILWMAQHAVCKIIGPNCKMIYPILEDAKLVLFTKLVSTHKLIQFTNKTIAWLHRVSFKFHTWSNLIWVRPSVGLKD